MMCAATVNWTLFTDMPSHCAICDAQQHNWLYFFFWALISSVMRWKGRRWKIMKPDCDRASQALPVPSKWPANLILAHSPHRHRQGSIKHHRQAVPQREFSEKKL